MKRKLVSRRWSLAGFLSGPGSGPAPAAGPPQGFSDLPAPVMTLPRDPSDLPLAASIAAGACFFLSGFSALVFEVIWMRRLHLVLGSTGFAIATVVAAYMGGLALGSYLFGRHADRFRKPFLVYGLLELGVGLYALMVPGIFDSAVPFYRWVWENFGLSFYPFSLLRFLLALAILVVPTTFMGATLPVMSRFVVRNRAKIGSSVGLLYALNTFGAVAGSAVSGFLLLPAFGEWKSLVFAVFGNFAIALVAVAYSLTGRGDVIEPGAQDPDAGEPSEAAPAPGDVRLARAAILAAFAGSGIASMAMQVAWSRLLSLLLGSSVYAFSVILTTFLAGLAIGSFVSSRLAGFVNRPMPWLSAMQFAAGAAALAGVFLFNYLFYLYVVLFNEYALSESFLWLFFANFMMAAILIFPPTLFMGAAFPLGLKAYVKEVGLLGRGVGELYSLNTLGAIFGSFLGGFVLLPLLGVQLTVETGVAIYSVTAALLALALLKTRLDRKIVFAAAALALLPIALLAAPRADPHIMSSGVYKYAGAYSNVRSYRDFKRRTAPDRRRIVFYREGITTTVSVVKFSTQYSVSVNGKIDGSSVGDMATQLLSAHIPMLFAENPKKALVIGYGTGVTLGSVALHEGVKADCIELEGAVVDAGFFFRHVNKDTRKLVEQGRVRIIRNDGRNILLATSEKWDVIVSEPSNPWISGASKLFTLDFFRIARERLNEGGVFGQWVQLYGMDELNVRTLIRTFREAFGSIVVFQPSPGADLLLIGRNGGELKSTRKRLEALFESPALAADLALVGLSSPEEVAAYFIASDAQAADFVARGGKPPLNTDDNSFIEFNAPRTFFYRNAGMAIQENLETGFEGPLDVFDGYSGKEAAVFLARAAEGMRGLREPLARALLAKSIGLGKTADAMAVQAAFDWDHSPRKALEALDEGLALDPGNRACLVKRARFARDYDNRPLELRLLFRARKDFGDDLEVVYRFGLSCEKNASLLGQALAFPAGVKAQPFAGPVWTLSCLMALLLKTAERDLSSLASSGAPLRACPELHHRLGKALAAMGDWKAAEASFRAHLAWRPHSPECRADLVELLFARGRAGEAAKTAAPRSRSEAAKKALEDARSRMGGAEGMKGLVEGVFRAVDLAPLDWKIAHDGALSLRSAGRFEEAVEAWRRSLRWFPGNEDMAEEFAYALEILADLEQDSARRAAMYREAAQSLTDAALRALSPAQENEYRHRAAELEICAARAGEAITVEDLPYLPR